MTRTVFDNDGVAHAWAQNHLAEGRSNNGNFYFDGPSLYSYGPHFVAGFILPDGVALLNADSYSVSTGRHLAQAGGAVSHRTRYYLPGLTELRDSLRLAAYLGGDERVGLTYLSKAEARARLKRGIREYCEAAGRDLVDESRDVDALGYLLNLAGLARSRRAVLAAYDKAQAKREKKAAQAQEDAQARDAARLAAPTLSVNYFDQTRTWDSALAEMARRYDAADILGQYSRALLRAQKWAKGRRGWKTRHDILKARRADVRAVLGRLEAMQERARTNESTRRAVSVLRHLAERRAAQVAGCPVSHQARDLLPRDLTQKDARHENPAQDESELATLAQARALEIVREGGKIPGVKERAALALAAMRADVLETARVRRARAAIVAEAREAERVEKERAEREAWLEGRPGARRGYWRDAQGGAYLRAVNVERDDSGQITGGTLETSQGAQVPLPHALRVFRFLKHCRETGQNWQRNGRTIRVGFYQVDSVDSDGSFRAGCHRINWPQVEALAARLGVLDLAPDSSVAQARAVA